MNINDIFFGNLTNKGNAKIRPIKRQQT